MFHVSRVVFALLIIWFFESKVYFLQMTQDLDHFFKFLYTYIYLLIIILNPLIFSTFYWSIVDLQCCDSVRGTAKWTSIHIHVSTLFQIIFLYSPLQNIDKISLCYIVGTYQLSILYIVVCICQFLSTNLSLPLIIPWQTCLFSTSVPLHLFCR